jgi:hypothetical protein
MRLMQDTLTLVAVMIALSAAGLTAYAAQSTVQLGPRPFYLVDQLQEGELKNKLEACVADMKSYRHHDFSIGHRGAALQFMDASDPNATAVEALVRGTPSFRTDLYATGGTLLSHKESIALINQLGAKFTPELKGIDRDSAGNPLVAENNGFGESGLDQQSYARKMIQEYIDAGVDARQVFAQSVNLNDVLQWIHEFPMFGPQAVYLISENPADPLAGPPSAINDNPPTLEEFVEVRNLGSTSSRLPCPFL